MGNQQFEFMGTNTYLESATKSEEILASRERVFGKVTLEGSDVFCADDRGEGLYIHMFGGALNIVYGLTVMQEVTKPDSVITSFKEEARSLTPVVKQVGQVHQAGVHSDTKAENGNRLRIEQLEGPVGCKYIAERQAISQLIASNSDELVAMAQIKRPELFLGSHDTGFALALTAAHGRLAERSTFFAAPSRHVLLAAINEGAKSMVVSGEHDLESKGIINLVPESAPDTGKAMSIGLPFYDQDSWAVEQANRNLHNLYPYDSRQQQIAELIDTLGTMQALGIDDNNIVVRRP